MFKYKKQTVSDSYKRNIIRKMLTMFYTPRNINILIIYYFLNFKIILTLHFFILFFIFNFFIINMITHIIIVKNEATA